MTERNIATMVRLLSKMAILPFVPGLNIDGYARGLHLPSPPEPRLSADDNRWRLEHGVTQPVAAE